MEDKNKSQVIDEWGVRPLQLYLTEMLKYFHTLCEGAGIHYSVMGGTALGVARHKGFIPWDDDIDLFMFEEDYIKFKKLFEKEGDKSKYYLEERSVDGKNIQFVKLRANNTTYIEEPLKDWDIHHGVFLDIFIVNECPGSLRSLISMTFWELFLSLMVVVNVGTHNKNICFRSFVKLLQWILPRRFLVDYARAQLSKYRGNGERFIYHYYPRSNCLRGVYPSIMFKKTTLRPFEDILVRCPVYLNDYLTVLYGDWESFPSRESIKRSQHASYWSLDKDFVRVKSGTFSDEKFLI